MSAKRRDNTRLIDGRYSLNTALCITALITYKLQLIIKYTVSLLCKNTLNHIF
jgi:hypothetical protein